MHGLPVMTLAFGKEKVNTTHMGKAMTFDLIEAKKSNKHFEGKLWLNGCVFKLISMEIHQQ